MQELMREELDRVILGGFASLLPESGETVLRAGSDSIASSCLRVVYFIMCSSLLVLNCGVARLPHNPDTSSIISVMLSDVSVLPDPAGVQSNGNRQKLILIINYLAY